MSKPHTNKTDKTKQNPNAHTKLKKQPQKPKLCETLKNPSNKIPVFVLFRRLFVWGDGR